MIYSYDFAVGCLWISADEDAVTEISWSELSGVVGETPLIMEAKKQMDEYFAGSRTTFDLPLQMDGTPFQKRVWEALRAIPYGDTRTYGHLLGGSARAVGMACNRNPLSIVVPCHRVVGAHGKLTGYAGGLDKKEFLLELERR